MKWYFIHGAERCKVRQLKAEWKYTDSWRQQRDVLFSVHCPNAYNVQNTWNTFFCQIHYGWAASDGKSLCQGLTWMFRGELRPGKCPVFSGRTWYPLRSWCSLCCKGWSWQGSVWGYHLWWLAAELCPAGGGSWVGSRGSLSPTGRTAPYAPHCMSVNVCTSRDAWVCLYLQSCADPCRVRAMSSDSVKSNIFARWPEICWFLVFFESWSIFLRIQIYSFGSSHAREGAGFALLNTLPSSTARCSWRGL